jgi:hypothetical protein
VLGSRYDYRLQGSLISVLITKNRIQTEKIFFIAEVDMTENFEILDGVLIKYNGSDSDVVIPDGVTAIGDDAFSECHSIESVFIPSSVTSIGWYAFSMCESLRSIYIPDSVTSIDENAFDGCKSLESVTIPNGLTEIRRDTFNECVSLVSVDIPNSVISIGDGAFGCCVNLERVTLSDSIVNIGSEAFAGCVSLTSINIPKSVKSIGSVAFSCNSLKSIVVEDANQVYHSECDCLIETNTKKLILGCKNSWIPSDGSVTSIGGSAFRASYLKSIIIPDSVVKIEACAFYDCCNLEYVFIPDTVTDIGVNAFGCCDNLTIKTKPGSYAEQYAKENSIPVNLI